MRWRRGHRESEQGEVLILVLIIMVVFSIVLAVFLNQVDSGFNLARATNVQSDMLYTTDAGIEWGVSQVATNQGLCQYQNNNNLSGNGVTFTNSTNPPAPQLKIPTDVTSLNVKCQQVTSSGSNNFGGFAVVAGVNSHGAIANLNGSQPNPSCESLSTDPVGGDKDTQASVVGNSTSCLTYPSGQAGPIPQWNKQGSPNTTTNLNGVFGLSPSDFWAGGTTNTGNAAVWHSEGDSDGWADVSGNLPNGSSSVASVFAAPDPVVAGRIDAWAVGSLGNNATVWYSTNSDTASSPTWNAQNTATTNPSSFSGVSGIYNTTSKFIAAIGTSNGKGYVSTFDGVTWSVPTQLGSGVSGGNLATQVNGVFVLDATHAWAVGASGGVGTVWTYSGPTGWDGGTQILTTTSLTNVGASDASHIWATGNGGAAIFNDGTSTSWTSPTTISNAGTLTGLYVADSTDIWVTGKTNANVAAIWYCNGAANCSDGSSPSGWTTTGQTLPTGTPALADVSGFDAQPSDIYAVGLNGTLLTYDPSSATNCSKSGTAQCLAEVLGGPMFNGNAVNLQSGLYMRDGNFNQYGTSSTCPFSPIPPRLVIVGGNQYCQANTVPNTILPTPDGTLDEPLPSSVPSVPSGSPFVASGTPAGCTLDVFTPGTYTKAPAFNADTTYFFESGVYYFNTGNWGGIGDQANLYIIGGQPAPGDVPSVSQNSPCWSFLQTQPYFKAGGYGVEWIMGGSTWFDIHSVHLELFTRQGGLPSEGAQGIAIREVPSACNTTSDLKYDTTVCVRSGSGWTTSAPNSAGGAGQLIQVDGGGGGGGHTPNVYIHGGIFAPDNNIEEFTSAAYQVTLGPVFANSIEFSYQNASVSPLQVSAGSPNFTPTTVLTATAVGSAGQTFQVQSVVETDLDQTTGLVTKVQEKSWRILPPNA